MLGIDPRAGRAAWTVFLLALLIAAAYAVRETLVVFMAALLFAYMLTPLVGMVERFTPQRVSPRIALAIVYLILVGVIVALAITLGSRLVDEANSLAERLPALLSNRSWIERIPLPAAFEPVRAGIANAIQAQLQTSGNGILPYIGKLGTQILSGAKYVLYLVLIPILAFFFLKDGPEMRDAVVTSLVDESRRPVVDNILEDVNRLLGEYIRALVLLAISSFIANSLFLGISSAPYAILLAGTSALGEFIPVIGPAAAVIIVLLVSGLSGYTHLLLYVIFWILYRIFQDYVIAPYLMSRGVNLNPMLVLFGVLGGEQIAGVAGMFFSVPIIATLRVIFVRLKRAHARELMSPRT